MASEAAHPVLHERFDTTTEPPERRLEAWREAIDVLFDVEPAEAGAAEAPVVLDSWLLGSALLSTVSGPALFYDRSPRAVACDGRDLFMVQFYEEGQCHVVRGAPAVSSTPGDLMVTDLTHPMRTRETASRNISLLLPRSSIAPLLRAPDAQGGRVLRGSLPLVTLARRHLQDLVAQARHLSQADGPAVIAATAQLIAAVLNGHIDGETMNGTRVVLACEIRRFIEDHLDGDDVTPEALQIRHGLSRAALYRLFAMEGGVREYVQRRRLLRARLRLVNRRWHHRTVAEIGREAGYAHAQDFIRAYRRELGVSPGEDRDTARGERRRQLKRRISQLPRWVEWVRDIR